MKRSKKLALGLMATSAVALTACSEEEVNGKIYRSVSSCVAQGEFTELQCEAAYDQAITLNDKSGPRYDQRTICEQEFGASQCQYRPTNTTGSTGYWSPFIQGYLVSSILRSATGGSGLYSQPFYQTRNREYYTASGGQLYVNGGGRSATVSKKSMVSPPKPAKLQTRTSVLSRGGFGTRSSSRSSFSFGG